MTHWSVYYDRPNDMRREAKRIIRDARVFHAPSVREVGDRISRLMGLPPFSGPSPRPTSEILYVGAANPAEIQCTDMTTTEIDRDAAQEAHARLADLLRSEPHRGGDLTVRSALFSCLPHRMRIVTLLWHKDRALMRLPMLKGASGAPAETVGFPTGTVFPHDASLDQASRKQFRMPFIPFARPSSFSYGSGWRVVFPGRPEVLFIRQARFDGDPDDFIGFWQEEGVYPYVWMPEGALRDAASGRHEPLRRALAGADRYYREKARKLVGRIVHDETCGQCGSVLKSHYEKVPLKTMLAMTDDLHLDDIAREVMDDFISAGYPRLS